MSDGDKLGPTGRFPHGKLAPHDEGELAFGVSHDRAGNVLFDFGKPIRSLAMPQESAINLARLILRHAGVKKVEIEL